MKNGEFLAEFLNSFIFFIVILRQLWYYISYNEVVCPMMNLSEERYDDADKKCTHGIEKR